MASDHHADKILLVDDTTANLRLLSQILAEQGYTVRAVSSGMRALESVETDLPDLILLDIRMPGMDGFEVCRLLKQNPRSREVPVLFISALNDIQDKMEAFSSGGLDYITKPFQIEEVAARVETHLALRRLQKDLQETNDRMQRELDLAARVQASMMRRRLPEIPGWQLAVELMPAKLTCGDFFDAFRVPDGRIALLIADVVDKGVGAALYMSMSCTLLRTFIMEHPSHPEEVFQAVNNRILEDTSADQFVTVFLGILDLENGRMTCSNAGHPPPLLLRADGTTQTIQPHGPVLGILEDRAWGNQHLQLSKGDKLVIYTDGITEAQNERAELFGMDRLTEMVRTCVGKGAEDTRDLIDHAVQQFVDGADQSDDIALMVLSRGE